MVGHLSSYVDQLSICLYQKITQDLEKLIHLASPVPHVVFCVSTFKAVKDYF